MNKELLLLLENNARYEVRDLASLLNEDETLVEKTIKDLEARNVIAGYHTIINWDKADTEISKAIIFVNCVPERESGYDKVAEKIARYPEVDSLYLISGGGSTPQKTLWKHSVLLLSKMLRLQTEHFLFFMLQYRSSH